MSTLADAKEHKGFIDENSQDLPEILNWEMDAVKHPVENLDLARHAHGGRDSCVDNPRLKGQRFEEEEAKRRQTSRVAPKLPPFMTTRPRASRREIR